MDQWVGDSASSMFLNWTREDAANFGLVPWRSRHRAHELPWFNDEGLATLIDSQPRTQLRVFMSGTDPTQRHRDHQPVDTTGASGKDIVEAVKRGKLWVNLQRIDLVDDRFRKLGNQLYCEIERQCAHFRPVWINRAFLFISSPGAMVYLHADSQANMLWHMRGVKRMFIYPAYDDRIVTQSRIEEICSGGEDDLEYRHEFEPLASAFDARPGDLISWPPRAPHRVENGGDLNVSLSTFHETVEDYEKVLMHQAEYFLRGLSPWKRDLSRAILAGRRMRSIAYRVACRLGYVKGRPTKDYYAMYRIDPTSEIGVSKFSDKPVLTEHSRLVRERARS
jgi:hypothetical protein